MPRAKKFDENQATKNITPQVISCAVSNEHLTSPHWIELQRRESSAVENTENSADNFFIKASLHDSNISQAVGAKTVETILRENGAIPMLHGDEQLEIKFSPYNGEIISIEAAEEIFVTTGNIAQNAVYRDFAGFGSDGSILTQAETETDITEENKEV